MGASGNACHVSFKVMGNRVKMPWFEDKKIVGTRPNPTFQKK
jgi:hypothetical protein